MESRNEVALFERICSTSRKNVTGLVGYLHRNISGRFHSFFVGLVSILEDDPKQVKIRELERRKIDSRESRLDCDGHSNRRWRKAMHYQSEYGIPMVRQCRELRLT
jgi:hypothetical protein